MQPESTDPSPRHLAIQRCEELIARYDSLRNRHRIAYHTLLVASLVLSGITPVLVLATGLSPVIQALPAALAAIATGVIGIFQWRDSYPRCTYVCESLRSEETKYRTRTTPAYSSDLADQQALNNFVMRVEAIVINEITDWRAQTQTLMQNATETTERPRVEEVPET
jgi:hypothetical protein